MPRIALALMFASAGFGGCANRQLRVESDGGIAGTTGTAGTMGGAGTTGAAGTTGGAGTTGAAGTTATAGVGGASGGGTGGADGPIFGPGAPRTMGVVGCEVTTNVMVGYQKVGGK